MYASTLVWYGVWPSPRGLSFLGFHVWDKRGDWIGVYSTKSRAKREAK